MFSQYKSIFIVVNPSSGGGLGSKLAQRLQELVSEKQLKAEFAIIGGVEQPKILNIPNVDMVMVIGGDGTVSHMLPPLLQRGIPVALIPIGTGNDLAREIKIPSLRSVSGFRLLVESYLQSKTTAAVSVACVQSNSPSRPHRHFINYLSFGFDASVVHRFSTNRPKSPIFFGRHINRAHYGLAALREITYLLKDEMKIRSHKGALALPQLNR